MSTKSSVFAKGQSEPIALPSSSNPSPESHFPVDHQLFYSEPSSGISSQWCVTIILSAPKTFSSPKRKSHATKPSLLLLTPGKHSLGSVPADFPIPDVLCKWNHTSSLCTRLLPLAITSLWPIPVACVSTSFLFRNE